MAFIGNQPLSQAFITDQFSGNGSTTAFTMSVAPANTASVLVSVSGILQDPSTYSVSGTTLTFSGAPPSGTGNISARYLGIPASGVTTTAYRTVTEFTATASQTTFTPSSYTPGYINVYQNGARLGSADYTATNGTTVVLAVGATAGDLIATESFYVSSVLNAIPSVGGAVTNIYLDVGSANGTGAFNVPSGTTAQRPSSPIAGMQRWNTTLGQMEAWTGSAWQQVTSLLYSASYLVVAGGGGGSAGGGGAGGLLASTTSFSSGAAYTVTVGAGGAGGSSSANGTDSVLGSITALGGGGSNYNGNGKAGGSGGGAGYNSGYSGGSGTSGQGNNGGTVTSGISGGSGGGGGATGAGANVSSSANGGAGGAGASSSISGSAVTYAGGGGGGTNGGVGGAGGAGGGGTGGNSGNATSGTANTGGGGGGIYTAYPAGNGGSGIVIISYLGAQRGTGGTVTSSGGYTIHTFTSSGTYTA